MAVEVPNVSAHGFWILLGDRELFLPFETFPWFQDAPIGSILRVKLAAPHHVDLAVESIEYPERFPLVSKGAPNFALQRAGRRAARC